MAEAHPASEAATVVQPGDGSVLPSPWQGDIDALKQEMGDLRTALMKEIEELKKVKMEAAALSVPPVKIEVKSEPTEATLMVGLEEAPAPTEPQDDLDPERMEVTEVDDGPTDASRGTGGASERVANVPSRRQSTEEPTWTTPPRGEVLFRVNPEYAERIARANEAHAEFPAHPPQPREKTPPPPPPRSPSLVHIVRSTKPIGIIPASQAKRKHNFELIIEVPAKRFKASNYPAPGSSNMSVASSSRTTFATPLMPAKPARRTPKDHIFRKVPKIPFIVDLDPKIRDVLVTREYMGAYFGAQQRSTFSKPTQEQFNKHGYDHFVFVHGDTSPQAPTAPGEPGLVTEFKSWPAYDRYRIFGRVKMNPAKWQYMGLYKATKLAAWTPGEVKRQRGTVKWYWAAAIVKARWARPMIARITLRGELDREPTKKEVNDRVQALNDKSVGAPSREAIITALENGEEKLYPWKLECDDYEQNLQWEIANTFPRHEKDRESKKANASADT